MEASLFMEKFRPHVILSAAITLDGKIATSKGDSKISSRQDKIRVHHLRAKVDAILIGINSVKIDNPLLNVRFVKGKNPLRIILDSKGEISSKSRIIKTCNDIPTIIVVSQKISKKNFQRLEKFPVDIIVLGKKITDIKKLLKLLLKRKIRTILVEGGGTVNWDFIEKDLVDEVIVTVAPYLIGGKTSISFVEGKGFSKIKNSPKLKLKKLIHQKNEIVLHYSKLS